jgi:peptide/nickel transport system ATP-binding protein
MSAHVLEVDDLRVHYLTRFGARIQAVDGVTFKLKQGEILGIAGETG